MPITHIVPIEKDGSDSPRMEIFKRQLNPELQALNQLIDRYNMLIDIEQRKPLLIEILGYKKHLERCYGGRYIGNCREFSAQIHDRLFKELQAEFMACGVLSLHGLGETHPLPSISKGDMLSPLLANMSPKKLKELANILQYQQLTTIKECLLALFNVEEPGWLEFQTFLTNSKITILSSKNNKLFKIEPKFGEPYILKLEKREAGPELPEEILRNDPQLQGVILSYGAKRQCVVLRNTYNLTTIPFCNGEDLLTYAQKLRKESGETRLLRAGVIYAQMARILLTFQAHHIAFPDMKNTNWLVLNNQLFISDTKSFLTANPVNNTLQKDVVYQATNDQFIYSDAFIPPEMWEEFHKLGQAVSVDKIHAHILGLNLYQFLIVCSDIDVKPGRRHFTNPVFTGSARGEAFKKIIDGLLEKDPGQRMSLQEACGALEILAGVTETALLETQNACNELIATLKNQYQYGVDDRFMQYFLAGIEKSLQQAMQDVSQEKLNSIHQKLKAMVASQQPAIAITKIIADFKAKAGVFTIGMRKKARNIETAMALVPIEKRADVMRIDCPEGSAVRCALSQHRLFTFFRSRPQGEERALNTKNAAKSYHRARAEMIR